jgi:hypothetical protein
VNLGPKVETFGKQAGQRGKTPCALPVVNRHSEPSPRSLTLTNSLRSELRVEDSRVDAGLARQS